jgi:predicted RNA-binding protein YlqC (UPF0109 family)
VSDGLSSESHEVQDFVEYLARSVVDHPEEVRVAREVESDGYVVYQLHVAPDDLGKVIGRRGRVVKTMRTLLKVASLRNHEHAILEID